MRDCRLARKKGYQWPEFLDANPSINRTSDELDMLAKQLRAGSKSRKSSGVVPVKARAG